MNLFDTLQEKAAGLLGGASDKVSEVTGIELPGAEIADQLTQNTTSLTETGQNIADTYGLGQLIGAPVAWTLGGIAGLRDNLCYLGNIGLDGDR